MVFLIFCLNGWKTTNFEIIQQTAKIILKIPACKELSPCLPASSRLTGKNKIDADKPQSLKENQYQSIINAMLWENLFLLLQDKMQIQYWISLSIHPVW